MKAGRFALESLRELRSLAERLDSAEVEAFEDAVLGAKRVFVGGAGRTLLAMKFFAMRLMQIGLPTFLVGEVCTPSIGGGDLLIVGSGSGETGCTLAVVNKAKAAGAKVAALTRVPDSSLGRAADLRLTLRAETPEDAAADYLSIRPDGNAFEQGVILAADAMVWEMMLRMGIGLDTIRRNHANLE
ncbi:6-phospho-3-hexuloisomerase [uncultured Anaerotruncus sp.]|uniref:6-phospho-3-hexuloisomerase n=1 Tax=uncultured Anaerotruncus sp. TaxID=905011 RepID=UPI00280BC19D|nr:6-phospho-3-hexuloisomerase [uncultured Anaerotruncus sp.]